VREPIAGPPSTVSSKHTCILQHLLSVLETAAGDPSLSEALIKAEKDPATVSPTIDSAALDDYLHSCGEWTQELPIGFNTDMGVVTHALRRQVRGP
jgi:hypothetical protein